MKEIDFHSEKISTQVRTVAFGLLITIWGFLIGQSKTTFTIDTSLKKYLLWVGFFALCVLFLDFLQYLFGYLNNNALMHKMEKENLEKIGYNYKDLRYLLQKLFFGGKIILIIVSFLFHLIVIIPYLTKEKKAINQSPGPNSAAKAAPSGR